jgi:hypothetical protein
MAIITPHGIGDVDSLTRELLEKLRANNAELKAQVAKNLETIAVLERRLNLVPMDESVLTSGLVPDVQQKESSGVDKPSDRFTFKRNAFFGLKQRQAVIALLRAVGEPLAINDMLEILQATGYPFGAQSPYRVLHGTLREAPEIQKQGTSYGLKEWQGKPPANGHSANKPRLVGLQPGHPEPHVGSEPPEAEES